MKHGLRATWRLRTRGELARTTVEKQSSNTRRMPHLTSSWPMQRQDHVVSSAHSSRCFSRDGIAGFLFGEVDVGGRLDRQAVEVCEEGTRDMLPAERLLGMSSSLCREPLRLLARLEDLDDCGGHRFGVVDDPRVHAVDE